MPNLRFLSLIAASLFAITCSSDTYVSPEKNAAAVFVGAEFSSNCSIGKLKIDQHYPRATKRRNAIATRFQVMVFFIIKFEYFSDWWILNFIN
jgi:hypothetical protein